MLATSDFDDEIQDDLNAVVGHDQNFTNAIVRHSLDLKDESTFCNPNPLNVTFHNMKKFDLVNPVICKLASQVKASNLTDYELTKKKITKRWGWRFAMKIKIWDKKNYDGDDNKPGGKVVEHQVRVQVYLKLKL